MAPEAPEMPTTMRRVMPRALRRSGWHGGAGVARDARVPSGPCPPRGPYPWGPVRACERAWTNGVAVRGGCASARPPDPGTGPAAPQTKRRMPRSGRVSLGGFLGGPMTHTHVATAIAKQCVDLAIVGHGANDFADEQDVITGRALLSHLAPEHRETPFHCRRRETGLLDDRDLEGGELVGPLGRLARGNRELLL